MSISFRVRMALAFAPAVALAALPAAAQHVLADDVGPTPFDDAEITPDGTLIVTRAFDPFAVPQMPTARTRVYDALTGALVADLGTGPEWAAVCQDAVAVTDTRAVVLGGRAAVLDLSQNPPSVLALHPVGNFPRDVAITPDGTLAVVRGGSVSFGPAQFVIDLANGAILASSDGQPRPYVAGSASFDVDSVVATDSRAVVLSYESVAGVEQTRVTIWDLQFGAGMVPSVAYDSALTNEALPGAPHDLTLTPDGQHAAVRTELSVGLYSLGGQPARVWERVPWEAPGPIAGSAMDSIEASDLRIATISRTQPPLLHGAQIDLFDLAGNQWFDRIPGDPSDLAVTPDGTRLVVRTSEQVALYDLTSAPAGNEQRPIAAEDVPSSFTSFGAGLDSVIATDELAVTLHTQQTTTLVKIWRHAAGQLELVGEHVMPDRPVDVDVSPGGEWAVVSGLSYVVVYDLRTGLPVLEHDPTSGGHWPWCDGVAVSASRAVAFGYGNWPMGWLSVLDLFAEPASFCVATPNSTGVPGRIHATGQSSVAANDLTLWGTGLPEGFALLTQGTDTQQTPFGNGFDCVGGTEVVFTPRRVLPGGIVSESLDFASPPAPAGLITPGSTWHFQMLYRDPFAGGFGFDATDGLSILFTP